MSLRELTIWLAAILATGCPGQSEAHAQSPAPEKKLTKLPGKLGTNVMSRSFLLVLRHPRRNQDQRPTGRGCKPGRVLLNQPTGSGRRTRCWSLSTLTKTVDVHRGFVELGIHTGVAFARN